MEKRLADIMAVTHVTGERHCRPALKTKYALVVAAGPSVVCPPKTPPPLRRGDRSLLGKTRHSLSESCCIASTPQHYWPALGRRSGLLFTALGDICVFFYLYKQNDKNSVI